MGVGAGLYMYAVVVQKFTFAISSPDEFLSIFFYYQISNTPFTRYNRLSNQFDNRV